MASTTGLLLINLGTPESPEPDDVGRYLKEFLADPFVIDIPAPLRWLLVNVLIVPRRKHASSELYKKVWGPEGSPLMVHSLKLNDEVRKLAKAQYGDNVVVELGMRYGQPSLEKAIGKLLTSGVTRIVAFPLYPQYSLAATETAIVKVKEILKVRDYRGTVDFIPAFYHHEAYLDAVVKVSKPVLDATPWDKILFSYHGLPERQVMKTDPTGQHCNKTGGCCDAIIPANVNCYRAQSYATTRSLVQRLKLTNEQTLVGFQSRLGRTPWIRPHSDEFYRTLPKQGVKRLLVMSPSFVADCLETLEEIQIRGREEFRENGGEELTLVPSLNGSPVWAEAVLKIAAKYLPRQKDIDTVDFEKK